MPSSVHADPTRWTMNFHSINEYNVLMNSLSGNFFPLTEDKKRLGLGKTIYVILGWIFILTCLSTMTIGLVCYAEPIDTLQKAGPTIIVSIEVIILSAYLNSRQEHLRNYIIRVNSTLIESDELKRCIRDIVDLNKNRLKIYAFAGVGSVVVFAALPILKIFDDDPLTYNDYTLPAYAPGAPFTPSVFALYVIVQTISCTCIMMKKVGIDIYTNYCITLLTAEYRYLQGRITAAFGEKDENFVINALKECVKHHCNIMECRAMLVDILSLNIGLTYLLCIAGFCCLAFTFIRLPGGYITKLVDVAFTSGSMLQVFVLCWCIQELLEASTSVADGAFYENWCERGAIVRSIFRIVGLGNQIECRLTAFRIVDLTVPTFATILNQAYSACLLLLRF